MRKLFTFCIALAAGLLSLSAAGPKLSRQVSPQTQAMAENGGGETLRMLEAAPSLRSFVSPKIAGMSSRDNLPGVLKESRAALSAMKADGDADDLYGWLILSSAGDEGFMKLGYDGSTTSLFSNATILSDDYYVDALWLDGDKVGMIVSKRDTNYIYGFWYYLFEQDGTVVENVVLPVADYYYRCAYNYSDKKVYGYNFSEDGDFQWTSFDPATQTFNVVASGVSTSDYTARGLTYNSKGGFFVGLKSTTASNAVKIDPATGVSSVLGTITLPQYIFGFGYSSSKDSYVLNQVSNTGCSLDLLDPTTLAITSSAPYSGVVEFSQIVEAEPVIITYDDNAPMAATDLTGNFVDASLTGKIKFNLPTATIGGIAILGNVSYTLTIDGKFVKRGAGAAGSSVSISVDTLTEGLHNINVTCSLGVSQGPAAELEIYTGNDTPMAPAQVNMLGDKVTWTAVTEGVHAGYINPSAVTYNVYLNGKQIATGVRQTQCSSKLDPNDPVEFYVAQVEAVFDGKTSEKTSSSSEAYGGPMNLPVTLEPDEQQASLFTIVNANNDTRAITYSTLTISSQKVPVFGYTYSTANAADDWLFLPAINFSDPDKIYEFSMNAFRHYSLSTYQEKFEVKLATAPSADAIVSDVMPVTTVANSYSSAYTYELANYYNATFSVPEAGAYYIGIHVVSDKNRRYLYMRDFKVSEDATLTLHSPKAVSDLSAVAGEQGALNATVTFTMPAADFSGNAYADDKVLSATVTSEGCDETTVSGKPGETVSTLLKTLQGDNNISVTTYDGSITGETATTVVYTGVSALAAVEDFQGVISEDNMTVTLSWKAPTTGSDGGYINTTGITYFLTQVDETGQYWEIVGKIGVDVFEQTITLPEGTPVDEYILGVVGQNEAGYGNVTGDSFVLGTPHATPLLDNFSDGTISYGPLFTYKPTGNTANFNIANPYSLNTYLRPLATADRRVGLICYPGTTTTAKYSDCGFIFAPMTTKGLQKPAVGLEVCAGAVDKMYVYASAYGIDETLLATFDKAEYADLAVNNVTAISVPLPEQFDNLTWVQISVRADVSSRSQALIIYSFKMFDNLDNDFAVTAVNGPANAQIGSENTYTVTVANLGIKEGTSPAGKWILTNADGDVLANVSVASTGETIESGDVENHVISFNPTADDLGLHKLTYTLDTPDDKALNDSHSIEFNVVKGLNPVVTDLKATEIGFDKVALAWTRPQGAGLVLDSFEDETPFVLDGVSDMIGQFKRVDGDGKTVYGSQAANFASIPGAYGPSSFMVWSQSQVDAILGTSGLYPAKTGDQFLIAFCPDDASQADDWLISPAVIGGSDVSFALRALTYQYGAETVELMVSSTNDTPEAFEVFKTIEVMEENVSQPSWQEYTFTLPEDAKYFAIHYTSTDIFGLMVDDIEYAPLGSDISVDGFTIFRNSGKLASIGALTSYDDETVEPDTDYTYFIVPLLSNGKDGLRSNTLSLRTSGVALTDVSGKAIFGLNGRIIVKGYEGQPVSIVGTDGVVRSSSAKAAARDSFDVAPGIYVVKAGKDIVKITVK